MVSGRLVSADGGTDAIRSWLDAFSRALSERDVEAAVECFHERSFWRDLVAFTWSIETCEGQAEIRCLLETVLAEVAPRNWHIEKITSSEAEATAEALLSFETELGRGTAYVRVRDGRCFTLLTALQELKGFEEALGHRRPLGAVHSAQRARRSWSDERAENIAAYGEGTKQPYVLVVGGGHAGLAIAARLGRLNVPTLIVDSHQRVGDQWRLRYKSLTLHDPVWFDHLPYLPFPESWPVFTPKDKFADWLELYAGVMDLDIWTSTDCLRADFDERAKTWKVTLRRDGADVELRPAHLVMATGMNGKPRWPDLPGMASFGGRQCHSGQYTGGEDATGIRAVVIGSNNSAHDVCMDLWENGADVTMVQRSPTHIINSSTMMNVYLRGGYSQEAVERGVTTERADLMAASYPFRLLPEIHRAYIDQVEAIDAEFYAKLEAAGFLQDFGADRTGLVLLAARQRGGYYINVGASELLIAGDVKLRAGVGVERVEPTGIVLTSGELLPADLIVYATGFFSAGDGAAEIVSKSVMEKVGQVSGYGSGFKGDPGPWVGELRNMWKPTAQEGLWFTGGGIAISRNYSRYLALQLKARFERMPVLPFSQHSTVREKN